MKRYLALILAPLLVAHTTWGVSYFLEDFDKKGNHASFGFLTVGNQTYFKVGLSPDVELGPLKIGVDVNTYVNASGTGVTLADTNTISIRKVGYTHDDVASIDYGVQRGVRYGYGLLVNQYRTDSGGATNEFSGQKAGVKGWLKIDRVRLDALSTGGNVHAGRLEVACEECPMIPLKVGATYIIDQDGVSSPVNGSLITRPAQSGYAVDIGYPVFGEYLTLFTEYAKLTDQGSGVAAGALLDLFSIRMTAQLRSWSDQFVPGYFDDNYESTTFDFNQTTIKGDMGGLVGLSVGDEGDPYRVGLQWENFRNQQLISGAVGWAELMSTTGVLNYTYPLVTGGLPVINGTILYRPEGSLSYLTTIKRTYFSNGQYNDTVSVGIRLDVAQLFKGR